MDRSAFIKKLIRFLLFGLLVTIAAITGSRIVNGSDCSSCPGKGICKSEDDCSIYLSR
ncbi:MAG: hypothetical protein MUF36_04160 [Bacteroidales bacterium]|jgi:hypothetical protein|nr:hypothetical protein [Bacteroidales bacterium]